MNIINSTTLRVTSPFGWRIHPVTGQKHFHNGVDLAAPVGTEIYAPEDSILVSQYIHATGGKTVILKGVKTNNRYAFCHLSEFDKHLGDQCRQGDCIGKTGATGRCTGPHLHFGVCLNCCWDKNNVPLDYQLKWTDPYPTFCTW